MRQKKRGRTEDAKDGRRERLRRRGGGTKETRGRKKWKVKYKNNGTEKKGKEWR